MHQVWSRATRSLLLIFLLLLSQITGVCLITEPLLTSQITVARYVEVKDEEVKVRSCIYFELVTNIGCLTLCAAFEAVQPSKNREGQTRG